MNIRTGALLLSLLYVTLDSHPAIAKTNRCYVSVFEEGMIASETLTNLSVSLISKYIERVEEIPRAGISTDTCYYQVNLSKENDSVLATLTGPEANGVGKVKGSGGDGAQKALLSAIYQAAPEKQDTLCRDFGEVMTSLCGNPAVPVISIAHPTAPKGVLTKGICVAPASNRDYRHCEFQRHTFRNLDLSGSDFSGIDMSRAHFLNCNLSGTRFAGSDLERTVYTQTVIKNAVFSGADMERAKFIHANLEGVDFSDTRLDRAQFTNSTVTKVSMKGVILKRADFVRTMLNLVDLSNSDLENASFSESSLDFVDLTNAILDDTDLEKANLSNVVR